VEEIWKNVISVVISVKNAAHRLMRKRAVRVKNVPAVSAAKNATAAVKERDKGGNMKELETEGKPEIKDEEHSAAYWWFIHLYHPGEAQTQLRDTKLQHGVEDFAQYYTEFIPTLNDQTKRRLEDVKSGHEDRNFINTLAQGFEKFAAQKSEEVAQPKEK